MVASGFIAKIALVAAWIFIVTTVCFGLLSVADFSNFLRQKVDSTKRAILFANASFFSLALAACSLVVFALLQLSPPENFSAASAQELAIEFVAGLPGQSADQQLMSVTLDRELNEFLIVLSSDGAKYTVRIDRATAELIECRRSSPSTSD